MLSEALTYKRLPNRSVGILLGPWPSLQNANDQPDDRGCEAQSAGKEVGQVAVLHDGFSRLIGQRVLS